MRPSHPDRPESFRLSSADDESMDPELEAELEEDFPLGDGTAETSSTVTCPYCAEDYELSLDPGSGNEQEYIEDCQVCCQPCRVLVSYGEDGGAVVSLEALDE